MHVHILIHGIGAVDSYTYMSIYIHVPGIGAVDSEVILRRAYLRVVHRKHIVAFCVANQLHVYVYMCVHVYMCLPYIEIRVYMLFAWRTSCSSMYAHIYM